MASAVQAASDIKTDSVRKADSVRYMEILDFDESAPDFVLQKLGHDIPKDCGPSRLLAPPNGSNFFSETPALDVSEPLLMQILASKNNKYFRCSVAEPALECIVRTDSLELRYYTNEDSTGLKGGNLTYLKMIGGEMALYKNRIKIGAAWEEFLKITGISAEYKESEYRCAVHGGAKHWFYFTKGVLREIARMDSIGVPIKDIEEKYDHSLGHERPDFDEPIDYLIPYDDDIFYTNTKTSIMSPLGELLSDGSVLDDVSESLVQELLASKGNKKFRCDIVLEPHAGESLILECSIRTDSLHLKYSTYKDYTHEESTGLKGGSLEYVKVIGGGIDLFGGKIKIGATWEEFSKILGADMEYKESKYRCISKGGSGDKWFYFVDGILREIVYVDTL